MSLKIFQLAKELGIDSKVIIKKCEDESVPSPDTKKPWTHMSPVSAGIAATIKEWFASGNLMGAIESNTRMAPERTAKPGIRPKLIPLTNVDELLPPSKAEIVAPVPVVKTRSLSDESRSAPSDTPRDIHHEIKEDDEGWSYERIFGPYLKNATTIQLDEPYLQHPYQVANLVMFCEAVIRPGSIKTIVLTTKEPSQRKDSIQKGFTYEEFSDALNELESSLKERGVTLTIKIDSNLHDRKAKLNNGWVIVIGRGLHFFKKVSLGRAWFRVGAYDTRFRYCQKTRIDIFLES